MMIFPLARNTMFTDYWKVLVFNISKMENTVFFWAKKLVERWYLLGVFELSMIFRDLENMVFLAVFLELIEVLQNWAGRNPITLRENKIQKPFHSKSGLSWVCFLWRIVPKISGLWKRKLRFRLQENLKEENAIF